MFRHLTVLVVRVQLCCKLTDASLSSDKDPLERGLVDDVLEGRVKGLEIFNVGHGCQCIVMDGERE